MRTRIVPYLIFFIVSLVGAYWVSSPRDKIETGKIWLDLEGKISTIEFKDSNLEVTLDTSKGWVYEVRKKEGEKVSTSSFKVNKTGYDVITDLEKLHAVKVIGSINTIDPIEYGFTENSGSLEINTKSETYRFRLGKRSFQTANLFSEDLRKNTVFLMKRRPINLLKSAKSRLYERNIHNLDLTADVDAFEVVLESNKMSMKKQGRSKSGDLIWSKLDGSSGPEGIDTWLTKVLKIQVKRYAEAEDSQKLDSLKPLMTISFLNERKLVETISLFRLEEGSSAPEYWLKSLFTQTYVLIDGNRAKTIRQDFSSFLQ